MKFSGEYLYRVRVTRYPDGAFQPIMPIDPDYPEDAEWAPVPGWEPPGWRPEGKYVEIMGTSEFVWPVTNKVYGSRSTAKKRADLLESFGAAAVIQRSSRISWPGDDRRGEPAALHKRTADDRGEIKRARAVVTFTEPQGLEEVRSMLAELDMAHVAIGNIKPGKHAHLGVGSRANYKSVLLTAPELDWVIEKLAAIRGVSE